MAFIRVRDADNFVLEVNTTPVGAGAGETEYNEVFTFIPTVSDATWQRQSAANYIIVNPNAGPLATEVNTTRVEGEVPIGDVASGQRPLFLGARDPSGDMAPLEIDAGGRLKLSIESSVGIASQDEGTAVPGGPFDTINFTGNVSASNAGGGLLQIDVPFTLPVFGGGYHYEERTTIGSTSSTSFQNYLTMTTASLAAGTYRVGVALVWRQASASDKFSARVLMDGSPIIWDPSGTGEIQQEPKDAAGDQRHPASGFQHLNLTSGVHVIDLEFRQQDGNTAFIFNSQIELWRVS